MAIIKTAQANEAALDWLVAKCEGREQGGRASAFLGEQYRQPSTDWAFGGPIIEREGISWHCGNKSSWHAYAYGSAENINGPTPLIAAMRCYVASKLGDEVDVPDEILTA